LIYIKLKIKNVLILKIIEIDDNILFKNIPFFYT